MSNLTESRAGGSKAVSRWWSPLKKRTEPPVPGDQTHSAPAGAQELDDSRARILQFIENSKPADIESGTIKLTKIAGP